MNRTWAILFALVLCANATALAAQPQLKGAQFLPQAKVSLAQARRIALGKEHGAIVDQELEREAGGSGLRYSFDVKVGKTVREVGVDAKTGAILEDSLDNGND